MARIRSVHPGLFTDPEFASLSDAAQIFFLGLLTEADDQGVFEWKPATLKMRLRANSTQPVDGLLSELTQADKVVSYEIDGRKYGAIRNFRKFQRPKKPNSIHPLPDEFRTYVGLSAAGGELEQSEAQRSSPPVPHQFGTGSEIPPQMEDEGEDLTNGEPGLRGDLSSGERGSRPPARTVRKPAARNSHGPPASRRIRRVLEPDWEARADDGGER